MEAGVENERKIREIQPRPQFPHWDYVGFVCDIANFGGVQILEPTVDIVVPAMFGNENNRETLQNVEKAYHGTLFN